MIHADFFFKKCDKFLCFEAAFSGKMVGVNLAVRLCIGGNDYISKFPEKSHTAVVQKILTPTYRLKLFCSLSRNCIVLDMNQLSVL